MDRVRPLNILVISTLLVALLVSFQLQAHQDGVDDLFALSLEDLLRVPVTVASLLDSDELHLASHISHVQESDWERFGARRTLDAIDHLPATMVLPTSNGVNVIAIRGYAQPTSARGIATTLDGIRLNDFLFGTGQYDTQNIDLGVLQNIEMIRGPASAIYGSDAVHGVLSLHAFESDLDLNEVAMEGASNGFYQASLRSSAPVTDSTRLNLALATSGEPDQQRQFEYLDPLQNQPQWVDKALQYQSSTLSAKLGSDPAAALSWRWGVYVNQYEAEDFPTNDVLFDSRQDSVNYMTRFEVTQKWEQGLSLEGSAYFRDSDVVRINKAPAGSVFPGGNNDLQQQFYGVDLTLRQMQTDWHHTDWALKLGFDVEAVEVADLYLQDAVPGTPPIQLLGGTQSREIGSLVLEASTRLLNEHWNLVYGGRLDHYSDFGTQGSPRLGIIFLPWPDTAIKLLYGQAFRAPTAFELYVEPVNGSGAQGNPGLQPEILDSLELVLLKQSSNWKGSIAIFQNRWKDTISLLFDSRLGTYSNTGESQAKGVETSLSWLPKPWWVDFNASYTESQNDTTGEDYELFPKVIVNLEIGYHWAAIDTELSVINRSFTNSDGLPDYHRTDLALIHNFTRNLQGFFNIINLLDRDNYLPSVLDLSDGYPDKPFSASIGLRYEF